MDIFSAPDLDPTAPPRHEAAAATVDALPAGMTFLRLMGVNYLHLRTEDNGDLYVTEHGRPFIDHLRPENWYEASWFETHRIRLTGTSTVYRVPTRPIPGRPVSSLQLVVKWSRVGQDVPLDTFTLRKAINADFNTPFEEFSLVEELRNNTYGGSRHILTQKPLAIYVPPERMQLWQTGRSRHKILSKIETHASVEIDILRSYIMLYGWIKGFDALEARQRGLLYSDDQDAALNQLTQRVLDDLQANGYTVADHKPAHAIVRVHQNKLLRRRDGQFVYALIDYELLGRTEAHAAKVRQTLRSRYLVLQRDRFHPQEPLEMPANLRPARVLEVDYLFARAESTGGILWLVGRDPRLFDYFLPERWRSKKSPLSASGRTWYARTKDGIHLVWKVSRLGELPPGDPLDAQTARMRELGYNSPFEKFALALEMRRAGIRTVNPRAIYVTFSHNMPLGMIRDDRRFRQFADRRDPDGNPILAPGPDYITIWGYWRGFEDPQAVNTEQYQTPIGAGQACLTGLLTESRLADLMRWHQAQLAAAGYQDVGLEPDHILCTYVPGGDLTRDSDGQIITRHCNFELVRRITA